MLILSTPLSSGDSVPEPGVDVDAVSGSVRPLLMCLSSEKEAVDNLSGSESRKRQTTAQSSTFEVGNFHLHLTAASTKARPAVQRVGAFATISTTSSFVNTSQIYQSFKNVLNINYMYLFKTIGLFANTIS